MPRSPRCADDIGEDHGGTDINLSRGGQQRQSLARPSHVGQQPHRCHDRRVPEFLTDASARKEWVQQNLSRLAEGKAAESADSPNWSLFPEEDLS